MIKRIFDFLVFILSLVLCCYLYFHTIGVLVVLSGIFMIGIILWHIINGIKYLREANSNQFLFYLNCFSLALIPVFKIDGVHVLHDSGLGRLSSLFNIKTGITFTDHFSLFTTVFAILLVFQFFLEYRFSTTNK